MSLLYNQIGLAHESDRKWLIFYRKHIITFDLNTLVKLEN